MISILSRNAPVFSPLRYDLPRACGHLGRIRAGRRDWAILARTAGRYAYLLARICAVLLVPAAHTNGADRLTAPLAAPAIETFQPGESLTYDVSWSKFIKAGSAVMEVREEHLPDGREALRFTMTSRTEGMLRRIYPMGDRILSIFDPQLMQSLSYTLTTNRKGRTRNREIVFDHASRTVISKMNEDPPRTMVLPDRAQDPLSAIYYLRTGTDLVTEGTVTFTVVSSNERTAAEVRVLGRERIRTPAGEFDTIKARASGGIFLGKKEVFLWLTDDVRRLPVMIKGSIDIGSLVFTLREQKQGGGGRDEAR